MSVDKSIQQAGEAIAKAIIEYQKILEAKENAVKTLEAQKASEERMAELFKEKMSEVLKENHLSPEQAGELKEAVANTLNEEGVVLKSVESESEEIKKEESEEIKQEGEKVDGNGPAEVVDESVVEHSWKPGTVGEALKNEKLAAGLDIEIGAHVAQAAKTISQ